MAHGYPQSQTRAVMQEKEAVAYRLLAQGLTTQQVCAQLRCSRYFVSRIRGELHGAAAPLPAPEGAPDHLEPLRRVGDALAAGSHADRADEQTLREAEITLIGLAQHLEAELQAYAASRGAAVAETAVMRAGLAALQEDLSWVDVRRHEASPAEVRAHLSHALHSATNALSLLRWARP